MYWHNQRLLEIAIFGVPASNRFQQIPTGKIVFRNPSKVGNSSEIASGYVKIAIENGDL